MTSTLQRLSACSLPLRSTGPSQPRPTPVAGALAALAVGGVGLAVPTVLVLLVWATEVRTGASVVEALRTAGRIWLLTHGVPLELPSGRLGLLPGGLLALPLWLLWRAGTSVSRSRRAGSVRAAAAVAAAVALPYAAVTTAVAALCAGPAVRPSLGAAALSGLTVALLGAFAGALRPDRLWRAAWLRLGERTRRTLPSVVAVSALLVAGGALLAGTSLAVHGARAAELAAAGSPGPVGGLALLLVGLSLVPNAVVWGAAWLAGPGFAMGVGTVVGPFGHELGPVPALPLLAALPAGGLPAWTGALALLVPLGAGALAGRLLERAARPGSAGEQVTGRALLVDVVAVSAACGVLWAGLAWLSGGPVGGARLADVGPSAAAVGAAVAVETALGAAAAVLVLRRRAAG